MLAAGEENGTAKRDAQCSVERDNERTGGAELGEEQVATLPHGRQKDVKDAAGWRAGEENEFTGAPGMESQERLPRTESAPSGV